MLAEALAAALVGVLALWLVLRPLLWPPSPADPVFEPVDQEETPRGVALLALKDIEFDRETGKLSDEDYRFLKEKYTAQALEALRAEEEEGRGAPDDVEAMIAHRVRALRSAAASAPPGAPVCPTCGPRPEADAVFCSTCGGRLPAATTCAHCGTALASDSRFCEGCGSRVAA
ncbi:MAG TPA: zinc ribbon domain-containing protein [Gemmatimonadales bacterium]|nr:zinc ribbon domain-containing protein [Gemmatimonadales bacterium]